MAEHHCGNSGRRKGEKGAPIMLLHSKRGKNGVIYISDSAISASELADVLAATHFLLLLATQKKTVATSNRKERAQKKTNQ